MDDLLFKSGGWLLISFLAILAIAVSSDFGFSVHMGIVAVAAALLPARRAAALEPMSALRTE